MENSASLRSFVRVFTYATYDLTNWATLKGGSPIVVVVDMAWGTVLTGTAALLGYLPAQTLGSS